MRINHRNYCSRIHIVFFGLRSLTLLSLMLLAITCQENRGNPFLRRGPGIIETKLTFRL